MILALQPGGSLVIGSLRLLKRQEDLQNGLAIFVVVSTPPMAMCPVVGSLLAFRILVTASIRVCWSSQNTAHCGSITTDDLHPATRLAA